MTPARRILTVGAVVIASATLAASPAVAGDGDGTDFSGNTDGGDVVIGGQQDGSDGGGSGGAGGDVVVTIPKPYLEYKYVPACSANAPEGGADALCGQAVYTCPEDRDIRYRVYTRQHLANGDVAPGADFEALPDTVCRGADDPPEGGPVQITTADIRDEARKAAPIPEVNVEPEDRSYVNLPTNVYASGDSVGATVTVLGQTIALTFEPTAWAWDFGDGGRASGQGIEGARVGQAGAVEHSYRRSGDASITVTRTYAVTFTVPGGQPTPLPGGVTATSEPYPLEIREIQATVTELG